MTTSKARAVADIHSGLILATIDIQSPIEQVFAALTDPAQLPKWWGQAGLYQTTAMLADLREGGQWRTDGVGADGSSFSVGGTYKVVQPPHRVDFTWQPTWEPGETLVSYNLEAIDGGTRLTLRHSGFGDQVNACRDHAMGWERVFGWLDGFLVPDADTRPAWFLKLLPPRPDFVQTLSPDEMAMMKAHGLYWRQKMNAGDVIVFGPVNDPAGSFGLGVVRARDEAELKHFQDNDPAILAGRGLAYAAYPMFSVVTP